MKSAMRGPLAASIDLYLAHKRSLGKQLVKVGQLLFRKRLVNRSSNGGQESAFWIGVGDQAERLEQADR